LCDRAPLLGPVRSGWVTNRTALAFLATAALLGVTPPAEASETLDTLNGIYKQVQLPSDAITAYYGDMMQDAALLELQRNNVKVLELTLRQARDRFKAGEVTRADLAQIESRLAAGRSSLHAAETQYAASRSRYIQAIEVLGSDVQSSPALPPVPPADSK